MELSSETAAKKRRTELIDTVCVYVLLLAAYVGCAAVGWGLTLVFHGVLSELHVHETYQHCDAGNPNCGGGYVSTAVFALAGWWAVYRAFSVIGGRRISEDVSRALAKVLGKTDNIREFDPAELADLTLALQTKRIKIHKSL